MNNLLTHSISKKIMVLPIIMPRIKINFKMFLILSFAIIITLLGFYIFLISSFSLETYQLQNYQKTIKKLTEENKALEISLVKINTLEKIEPKIQELGFEKIDTIHYLQVLETPILTKK